MEASLPFLSTYDTVDMHQVLFALQSFLSGTVPGDRVGPCLMNPILTERC